MDNRTKRTVQIAAAAVMAVVAAVLVMRAIRARAPYHVDEELLSGWRLAAAPPGDPAVVEVKPPSRLLKDLFDQVTSRNNAHALVAPERAAVPLVLSDEYSESLQGALSIDDIVNAGLDFGLDSVRFEPVCMGESHRENGAASEELIFAVFDTPAFDRFRFGLTPLFPEQAGWGVYNPPAVRLILPVAATSNDFDRWWPIRFNPQQDCGVSLLAE